MIGQRWLQGRTRWVRPSDRPLFDPRQHEVARVPERVARAIVEAHHYSRSLPSALRCYGLYRGPFCIGAVVIGYPMNDATLTGPWPDLVPGQESAEISRVVLLPGAAFNAASWTLSRVFELERKRGTLALLAFSDPVRRTTVDGRIVLPGHVGVTYVAHGFTYASRSRPRTLLLLPDGRAIVDRTLQKISAQERGWKGALRRLLAAGLPAPTTSDLASWTRTARSLLRPLKHGGNHRYLLALDPIVGLPTRGTRAPSTVDPIQDLLL